MQHTRPIQVKRNFPSNKRNLNHQFEKMYRLKGTIKMILYIRYLVSYQVLNIKYDKFLSN